MDESGTHQVSASHQLGNHQPFARLLPIQANVVGGSEQPTQTVLNQQHRRLCCGHRILCCLCGGGWTGYVKAREGQLMRRERLKPAPQPHPLTQPRRVCGREVILVLSIHSLFWKLGKRAVKHNRGAHQSSEVIQEEMH